MTLHATSAPIPIPKITKWYEAPPAFNYYGGDAFVFTPSPQAQSRDSVRMMRIKTESSYGAEPASFWGWIKTFFA